MVLKQVTSLYELSLQVLSDKIYKFAKEHCDSCKFCSVCKTEQCSVITPVMEMLNLPESIIQPMYNKVYLEYKSIFDSNTNLLYLFLSLLRFEHTSNLRIDDYCFIRCGKYTGIPFMIKFGKKINALRLKHEMEEYITLDKKTEVVLRSKVLQTTVNIQVLDFRGFEVVGLECTQLKVLSGIMIGGLYTTRESFKKLLFCINETGYQRNKYCDTLQAINFNHDFHFCPEDDPSVQEELNKIIPLLVQNVTHLKSVGDEVDFGNYFQTFKPGKTHHANFDNINFDDLCIRECIILKDFCPTVRKLNIDGYDIESGVAQKLSSFKCLEDIRLTVTEVDIYNEIFLEHWASLKVLEISEHGFFIDSFDLDFDVFIKNFPVLTDLRVCITNVTWSKTTQFKCLKKVSFNAEYSNMSWFESFASTVQSIHFRCHAINTASSDDLEVLLAVPFPNLEYLCIEPISYNFLLYSSVLAKLPKLEKFFMYDSREIESEKAQRMTELSQFLRENNLHCEFSLDG